MAMHEYNKETLNLARKIKEKDARIAELESQLQNGTEVQGKVMCDGIGLLPDICRLRREGKTDEEIATQYSDEKKLSHAQIGALLHPTNTSVEQSAMTQRARRLLGKA